MTKVYITLQAYDTVTVSLNEG